MSEDASRKRLLIVGSDVSDQEIKLLEKSGFLVDYVGSVEAARDALASQRSVSSHTESDKYYPDCFADGGDMGALMRSIDWANTALGPVKKWPQSLRNMVRIALASKFPMEILWGPDLLQLYNDGYKVMAGDKHPLALGRSSRVVWPEVWDFNEPIFNAVMSEGKSIYLEDQPFCIDRHGYPETAYFTLCYSPIFDDLGNVGGTLVTLVETTERKLAEEALQASDALNIKLMQYIYSSLDRLSAHIAILDSQGRIEFVNKAWRNFAENNPPVNGNVCEGVDYLACCDNAKGPEASEAQCAASGIRDVLSGRTELFVFEYSCHSPSTQRWFCMRVTRYPDAVHRGVIVSHEVITDRKIAEEQARRSKAMLDCVADNSQHTLLYYAKDLEGRFMMASESLAEFFGQQTSDQLLGKTSHDFLPQEIADQHQVNDLEVVTSKTLIRKEESVETERGIRTFLSTKAPLFDGEGRVSAVSGVSVDITEQKSAEQALLESEKRSKLIYETMLQGVVLQGADGRIIYANPAAERISGFSLAYLQGRTSQDLEEHCCCEDGTPFPGTDHPTMVALRTGQKVPAVVMGVYNRRAGQRRWLSVSAVPLFQVEGGPLEVYSIFEDITERKQAEDELLEARSEAESRAAELVSFFSCMTDGVVLLNSDGDYILTNDAAREILGEEPRRSVEERVKQFHIRELDGTPVKPEETASRRSLRGETIKGHRHKLSVLGGPDKVVAISASPVIAADGTILGATTVISDITELKQSEDELLEARTEAERRAAELESFFCSMTDGVVLHDAEGAAILANDAARKILGSDPLMSLKDRGIHYQARKLDGTPMKPEDSATGRALRGETVRDMRFLLTSHDGSDKVIAVNSSPVHAADDTIIGVTTVFRDITELAKSEHQRLKLFEREHRIAETLQQALIPPQIPYSVGNVSIAAKYKAALKEAQVGGDFYDVFELGNNKIGVLIGDVTGKGLKAAVRVAAVRYAVRSYAYLDLSPSKVMTLVNDALCRESSDMDNVLTAFYAVMDTTSGSVTYANAGHEPPVVCSTQDGVEELCVTGIMLGISQEIRYTECTRALREGDILVLFTDGITEAHLDLSPHFEKTGVIEHLTQTCEAIPEKIAEALLEAATKHAGGQLRDDAAIVVLTFSTQTKAGL